MSGQEQKRMRDSQLRLTEIDRQLSLQQEAIRQLGVEIELRKEAIATLRAERRAVALALGRAHATLKEVLEREIMARVATGMAPRDIARDLKRSPAVVSRVIEQAKAVQRKKHKELKDPALHRHRRSAENG
jgi:hypothetical protein